MARSRSKSLVQAIALDVPSFHDSDDSIDLLSEKVAAPKLTKSQSIPNFQTFKNSTELQDPLLLHPFTGVQIDEMWDDYVKKEYYSGVVSYDLNVNQELHILSSDKLDNFRKILDLNTNFLNYTRDEVHHIQLQLKDIQIKHGNINAETEVFNNESTKLIDEEQKLTSKIDSINFILKNFENLDDITKKLSTPNNLKLIRSHSFKKILENLNSSLDFLNSNAYDKTLAFKNIDVYRIKFRQCMTRSLTLVKDYLNNDLRRLENIINSQLISNREFKDIIIYKEFDNYLQENKDEFYYFPNFIHIYLNRIESKHELEYRGLLFEVLNTYFRTRLNLLDFGSFQAPTSTGDIVKFTQDQLSHIKKVLNKEHKLFKQFFLLNQQDELPRYINEKLYDDFFKYAIEPFDDVIRQRILKETNISSLCQLTNLLQSYYEFEDIPADEDVNFAELFQPILNDCQSRLIFRIQIFVDNKLIPYKPTPEDLNIGHKKVRKNTLDEDFDENLFEDLYLPLGKALTILSNIYELVNSIVFDDLAHYIVHSCIQILKTGAYDLCVKHLGKVDADLFYLKNLIILKYQLSNFDIQFVRTETSLDLTSGLSELYNLIRNGDILIDINQHGWLNLIKRTAPKIINNMIDAKLEIELEINNAINELLIEYLNALIEPIKNSSEKDSLEAKVEAYHNFKDGINDRLVKFKGQIISHINDYNILKILMTNLVELLTNYYGHYYEQVKITSNDVMEPDAFNNYFNHLVDDLLDDESLNNNLMDIKPLLKFDEELEQLENELKNDKNAEDAS